jgi:hypothetical protein
VLLESGASVHSYPLAVLANNCQAVHPEGLIIKSGFQVTLVQATVNHPLQPVIKYITSAVFSASVNAS